MWEDYDPNEIFDFDPFYHPDSNPPPETSLITFVWSGGESILLISLATKIIGVKQLILEVLRIPFPVDRQELSWGGQFLRDELTLQDYNIPSETSIILLEKIKVTIYMEAGDIQYEYVIHDGTTIDQLKAKLQAEHDVVIENKVLRMGNAYLPDDAQLFAVGVVEGTTLYLVERFNA
ncbi:polyubiquitin 8-like [Prunus avium]|uniref:Polyubiquitin 8-like n=1 Tax=Prunus avium TaxID=42229 RepID=A0A6P5RCD1_PRUAV|nr:polyubiquitin 8-like [Prunus avium]